jgi:Flp pilus assembly protein TadD
MHNLASTYQSQGNMEEAARLEKEVLEKRRRILGEEHPDTLATMHSLASTYQSQGKTAVAEKLTEEIKSSIRRGNGSFALRKLYEQIDVP